MNITWDISSLAYQTGVAKYFRNLIKTYVDTFDDSYMLFGSSLRKRQNLIQFGSEIQAEKQKIYPFPPQFMSYIFNDLHVSLKNLVKTEIFHSWEWYTPKVSREKLVVTIHDLTPLKFPELTNAKILKNHKKSLHWIQKEASAVIAVSQTTKQDILEYLNIPENKVFVIYEALPEENKNQKIIALPDLKKRFNINKDYILMIGTEKRKNLKLAVEAWKNLKKEFDLVIVGHPTHDQSSEPVIFTGFISDSELASLYHHSSCLLYPSLYEGFGLPILEAFYHKIPVVCSNTSSMAEIGQNAAILVNPYDEVSIYEGINKALQNKMSLIQSGKKELVKFSWEKTAYQTRSVYRSVMEGL